MTRYKNEDDLTGGIEVIYRRGKYITGNRRHDRVELLRDGEIKFIAKIKSVYSED